MEEELDKNDISCYWSAADLMTPTHADVPMNEWKHMNFKFQHPALFQTNNYAVTVTKPSVYVFYLCDMFRPNGTSSSGATNCIQYNKYKNEWSKVVLSEFKSQFHKVLSRELFRSVLRYYAPSSGDILPKFWDHLSVPSSGVRGYSWTLTMGPIGCAETSVRIYHYSPRNNPEERSSHLLSFVRLKSLMFLTLLYKYGLYKKSSYNI